MATSAWFLVPYSIVLVGVPVLRLVYEKKRRDATLQLAEATGTFSDEIGQRYFDGSFDTWVKNGFETSD